MQHKISGRAAGRIIGRLFYRLILTAGVLLLLYPFYANLFSELRADSVIKAYDGAVPSAVKTARLLEEARQYNEQLAAGQIRLYDPFSPEGMEHKEQYDNLLRISDDGMMGVVQIPCLDIRLPVYHGTDAATLERGAGHLSGTSLPVGGTSTHAVITGHTGLSGAKLFTDLTEIQEGDLIFLDVLGERLAYRVTDLYVVEPEDISRLYIVQGKDLLTLVTCTPYGINTHRLLVRSERTELSQELWEQAQTADADRSGHSEWMYQYKKSLLAGAAVLIVILIINWLWQRHKK